MKRLVVILVLALVIPPLVFSQVYQKKLSIPKIVSIKVVGCLTTKEMVDILESFPEETRWQFVAKSEEGLLIVKNKELDLYVEYKQGRVIIGGNAETLRRGLKYRGVIGMKRLQELKRYIKIEPEKK